MTTPKRKRRVPVGVAWRIKAGGLPNGRGFQPLVETVSKDYHPDIGRWDSGSRLDRSTTFDELVVLAGDGKTCVIHVEQMDERTYLVALGAEKRMVSVDRKGRVVVGEKYE